MTLSRNLSLFTKVKDYLKLGHKLKSHLLKYPNDWLKFQEIFNLNLNKIYQDILEFEKENIEKHEDRVYKLKKIFAERYRRHFLCGEFIKWSFEKPFGYSGDFKIIDQIYRNQPHTIGFDRLWDNYFQQLAVTRATRERKENFKKIISDFIKKSENNHIRIMSLASGPAREIKELLEDNSESLSSKVTFDCYDFDNRAIKYAKKILDGKENINYFQKNAVRLSLKRNIKDEIPYYYDMIYSTGLFDYLDETIAVKLIKNLRKVLKKDGLILISNVRNKYSNPSAGWMEWVAEWYLIYRTEPEFKKIFLDSGFSPADLKITVQQSKVMQYCFAKIG